MSRNCFADGFFTLIKEGKDTIGLRVSVTAIGYGSAFLPRFYRQLLALR